jgi:hypothetical protein
MVIGAENASPQPFEIEHVYVPASVALALGTK